MARLSKEKYVKNIQYEISVVETLALKNSSGKAYCRIEQTAGHIDETLYSGKRILLFNAGNSYWVRYWKFSIANKSDNETSLSEFITFEGSVPSNVTTMTFRYYAQILVEYDNESMTETDAMSRLEAKASNPQPTMLNKDNTSSRFLNPVGNVDGGRRGLIEADELSKLRHLKRNIMFWNDENSNLRDGEEFLLCVAKLDNTDPSEAIDVRFSSYLLNASFTVYVNKIYASLNNSGGANYDITNVATLVPDDYNGAITVDYFDARLEYKGGLFSERPVIKIKASIEKYAATGETTYLRMFCAVDLKNKDGEKALKSATITIGAKDVDTLSYFHKNVEQKESNGVAHTEKVPLNFFYPNYRIKDGDKDMPFLKNQNSNEGVAEIDEWTLGFTSGRRVSIPRPSEMLNIPQIITSGNLNDYKNSGYYWAIGNKNSVDASFLNVPKRLSGADLVPITDSFRLEVQNLNGYDNNALLYEPLYRQIYGLDNNDVGKISKTFIYQRLISLSATQEIVTGYDSITGKPTGHATVPYIYERLCIGKSENGEETWTDWNEVGRKLHSHKLEELEETPNSKHFTQKIYESIGSTAELLTNTPFVSNRLKNTNPNLYIGKNGDVFVLEEPASDKNDLGIEYGLYQKQQNGVKRIDIGGLRLLTPTSDMKPEEAGVLSKTLFDTLMGSQFLKNISGTNDAYVFWKNTYNSATEYNTFDIVNRENTISSLYRNAISFGFDGTQARAENGIAIGTGVIATLPNAVMIGSAISGGNKGEIGIGTGLDLTNIPIVFGKFNSKDPITKLESGQTVDFAIGAGKSGAGNNIFEVLNNGMIGVAGIKKFEFEPASGKSSDKYAFNVIGGVIDISEYAPLSDIEELKRDKVDVGSNFVTRFIGGDKNTPYDLISATDSNVQILPANNGKILYSQDNYLIFPEGFRIDFLTYGEEKSEDEDTEESEVESFEYVEVFIPGTITKNGKAIVAWCKGTDEVDENGEIVGVKFPPIEFNKPNIFDVDYSKISISDPVVSIDINAGTYTRESGDTVHYDNFENE